MSFMNRVNILTKKNDAVDPALAESLGAALDLILKLN